MGVITRPDLLEQSDHETGWSPEGFDATQDEEGLLDVLNLLLDVNTGSLKTRAGLQRDFTIPSTTGYWVRSVFPFQAPQANYLMLICTDGTDTTDNVRIYAFDIDNNDLELVNDADSTRQWNRPLASHWGLAMDGIWYGGTLEDPMYSWDPDSNTYNADASDGQWKELIDDVNDNVTFGFEYARDYAFKGNEVVTFDGKQYSPNRSIRYDEYDEDEKHYVPGDKVSRATIWDSVNNYWKSFKCILKHDPGDDPSTTAPGTGSGWKDYWTKVRLPLPTKADDDGDATSSSWDFVPVAAQTNVAVWHANRLWLRYDGTGDRSRVQFSAPIKPEKGEDIPETEWDPTNFAPGNTIKGQGGGWRSFNDGTHHGVVTALASFNQMLVVFKRQAVWALAGVDDSTFYQRRIKEGIGCVGPNAWCEHEGLLYFLSDEGLQVTDGQEVKEAPGNERVRQYIRRRLDDAMTDDGGDRREDQDPVLWVMDGFIWISLPDDEADDEFITLAYEPYSGSFWKTDMPVLDATHYRDFAVTKYALVAPPDFGTPGGATVRRYRPDAPDLVDWVADGDTDDIAWLVRYPWWSFGTLRQQRRIRRVWALVSGDAQNVTITAYRDYSDSSVTSNATAVDSDTPVHIEGRWFQDSHAVNFQLSGTAAAAGVYGMAVQTQRRRERYHT